MIPLIENSRKCKLIYSDRKGINGWKGWKQYGGSEETDYKEVKRHF